MRKEIGEIIFKGDMVVMTNVVSTAESIPGNPTRS